jgi:hypothetical protein
MKNQESKLIAQAIELLIKARNYSYRNCKSDLSLQITKEESDNYIYINVKGYEAATVATSLKMICSSHYSIQINSNENVNISIFKG